MDFKARLLVEYKVILKFHNDLVRERGNGPISVEEERLDAQLTLIERMLPNDQDELIELRG